jgi:hypothetical protein
VSQSRPRPRRPYRRTTAQPPPSELPTLFKRLERRMP